MPEILDAHVASLHLLHVLLALPPLCPAAYAFLGRTSICRRQGRHPSPMGNGDPSCAALPSWPIDPFLPLYGTCSPLGVSHPTPSSHPLRLRRSSISHAVVYTIRLWSPNPPSGRPQCCAPSDPAAEGGSRAPSPNTRGGDRSAGSPSFAPARLLLPPPGQVGLTSPCRGPEPSPCLPVCRPSLESSMCMDLDLTGACNANLTAVPLHPSSFPFYLCHSTLLEVSRFPRPSAPLDNCHNPTSQPSSPPPFWGPLDRPIDTAPPMWSAPTSSFFPSATPPFCRT